MFDGRVYLFDGWMIEFICLMVEFIFFKYVEFINLINVEFICLMIEFWLFDGRVYWMVECICLIVESICFTVNIVLLFVNSFIAQNRGYLFDGK